MNGGVSADAILPLAGVVVGGILTVGGQLMIEGLKRRSEDRARRRQLVVIARLQQDAFWTFQVTASRLFLDGTLRSVGLDPIYKPSRDDMRIVAETLNAQDWKTYASGVRYQAHAVEFAPTETSEAIRSMLIAVAKVDDARLVMSKYSGVQPTKFTFPPLPLSEDEIRALIFEYFNSDLEKAQGWVRRLLAKDAPPSNALP